MNSIHKQSIYLIICDIDCKCTLLKSQFFKVISGS